MENYIATNSKGISYSFTAADPSDVRHWVINHLDSSLEWWVNGVKTQPEILIMCINGLEAGKVFAEFYAPFIKNREELQEELDALLEGRKNPDYDFAWYVVKKKALVKVNGTLQTIHEMPDGNVYSAYYADDMD